MTKQESFKRRVRARMEKTGERYAAARQALLGQAIPATAGSRQWVAQPEFGDQAVKDATGKGWDAWCDIIERWANADPGGPITDHATIANHLQKNEGVDAWWSQSVTVGYERITGLRLPYQRADGTFTASKSATMSIDGAELRKMLLSDDDRADLFPGHDTELLSRPDAKRMRFAVGPGIAQITVDSAGAPEGRATGAERCKISVSHDKLPTFDDVERWKHYWSDWLAAIDGQWEATDT